MNLIALLLALAAGSAEASSSDTLFTKLDRNQDYRITPDEITDSQQSFFRRALRVADRNEDGALSRDEFVIALTDPKPVKLAGTNVAGRPAGMDLKQFDRNGDGRLTIDEVPAPMKERFQEMLDRVGQPGIAVDMVARYLAGERPTPDADSKTTDMKKTDARKSERPEIKPSDAKKMPDDDAKGLRAMMQQLDRNEDGKIDKDELPPRMRQFAQQMDTNEDGKIHASEMAAAMKRRDAKK
jgi:Ca2+-binding EF-hand superfamily protein